MNQEIRDAAATIFEKKGSQYEVTKTRFGDLIRGGKYTEAFINHYAQVHQNVVIDHGTTGKLVTFELTNFSDRNGDFSITCSSEEGCVINGVQAKTLLSDRKYTRKNIVERVKKDVAKAIDYLYKSNGEFYKIEFIVNAEKRTVVALMWAAGKHVHRRGIAKCAPDDCFNEDIGRAIALRRALGEKVPNDYLNAPAPEGFMVGDIVKEPSNKFNHKYEVFCVNFDGTVDVKSVGDSLYGTAGKAYLDCKSHWFKVIDDTKRYK